ncbi:MAG: 3-methylornithyl-N6-L-lysine dehydrogenase PylD [Dehalococcoidia bacterium]|nr:3-methylornithyl-N6-L-lysine dehydrogenase PylD [Dehalococcoidia bacterium]
MTRLTSESLMHMAEELDEYDMGLLRKTGCTLREIACQAADVPEADVRAVSISTPVAVIPITSGEGVIGYFAQAVQSIVNYIGFTSFVTNEYDVAGLAEGIERGAKIIFLADDDCFVAINLPRGLVADNAEATARGYVTALKCLSGELRNRKVLVIGAGLVGSKAVRFLKRLGSKVAVFDIDQAKTEVLAREYGVIREENFIEALQQHTILLDASPASEIIQAEHIKSDTVVAACGIPLGLSSEAYSLVKDRLVHDPLQIGVATMLTMAVK